MITQIAPPKCKLPLQFKIKKLIILNLVLLSSKSTLWKHIYMLIKFSSSIRSVIAVNGMFLKGEYKGIKDSNNHIYPFAFGINNSKNDASWLWFFTKLR